MISLNVSDHSLRPCQEYVKRQNLDPDLTQKGQWNQEGQWKRECPGCLYPELTPR